MFNQPKETPICHINPLSDARFHVMSSNLQIPFARTNLRQGTSKRFSLLDFQLEVQGSSFKWFFARSIISLGCASVWESHLLAIFWRRADLFMHTLPHWTVLYVNANLVFFNCITRPLLSCRNTMPGNFLTGLNTFALWKTFKISRSNHSLHNETSLKSSSGPWFTILQRKHSTTLHI